MSPSSTIPTTAITFLVENGQLPQYQAPVMLPSIIFAVLFGAMTIFHIYHIIIKVHGRRIAWVLLSTFSFSRFLAYSIQFVWAQGLVSKNLAISQGVFLNGGFLLSCEALYIFLTDWIVPLVPLNNNSSDALAIPTSSTIQTVTTSTFIITKKIRLVDRNSLLITKLLLLPVASLLGAIGCAKYYSASNMDEFNTSLNLLRASAVSFTILVSLLLILITYYAIRYSDLVVRTKKGRLIAVLYFSASLLLLEAVYKVVRGFSVPTDVFAHAKWVPYVFETAPELLLLIFLGFLGVFRAINVQNGPTNQIPSRKLEEASTSEKHG